MFSGDCFYDNQAVYFDSSRKKENRPITAVMRKLIISLNAKVKFFSE